MNAATYLPDLHAHVLNGICVSAQRERERAREYGPGGLAFHFLFSSDNEIQVTFSYVHVDMNKERRSHSVVITNRRQPKRIKKTNIPCAQFFSRMPGAYLISDSIHCE